MSTQGVSALGTGPVEADLRYPVGRFVRPEGVTRAELSAAVEEIGLLPRRLREAVAGLGAEQLDTPYREGGWTVRQVVHHVADSHGNAVHRVRFALTEDAPTIKPYDEAAWARLPDALAGPVDWSLVVLDGLHARWAALLGKLTDEQWERSFVHPENGLTRLDAATRLYAWHGRHHTAHIAHLRAARGW